MPVKRRTGIIAALVAVVALLALANCGPPSDSGPSTSAAQPDAAAPNASSPDAQSTDTAALVEAEEPELTASEEALQHGFEITGPHGARCGPGAGVHRAHHVAQQPALDHDGAAG